MTRLPFLFRSALAAAVLLAAASGAADTPNFPLGTFVYVGSVLDHRHEVRTSADNLVIQAVSTNGNVLASCRVTDPVVSSGVNFVLEVPVAARSSSRSAAIGDELRCVVLSGGGTAAVSTNPLPAVAAANAIAHVNVVAARSTVFAAEDGTTVSVSDNYLAGLAPYMQAQGHDAYDPFADWDGDGVSNYAEYAAGTSPFDPSDFLHITFHSIASNDDEPTVIGFEYAGGHLYSLVSTPSLPDPSWTAESFAFGSEEASPQQSLSIPGDEASDVGTATLYLVPATDSPVLFYGIRAE